MLGSDHFITFDLIKINVNQIIAEQAQAQQNHKGNQEGNGHMSLLIQKKHQCQEKIECTLKRGEQGNQFRAVKLNIKKQPPNQEEGNIDRQYDVGGLHECELGRKFKHNLISGQLLRIVFPLFFSVGPRLQFRMDGMDAVFNEEIGLFAKLNNEGVRVGDDPGIFGIEGWGLGSGQIDKPKAPEFYNAVMLHFRQVKLKLISGGDPLGFPLIDP